jgi:hypothetical protein
MHTTSPSLPMADTLLTCQSTWLHCDRRLAICRGHVSRRAFNLMRLLYAALCSGRESELLSSHSSAQGPMTRTASSPRPPFSAIHRRNGPKGHMKTPPINHEDVNPLVCSLEINLLLHLDAGKSLSMQCGRGSLARCCRGSSVVGKPTNQ